MSLYSGTSTDMVIIMYNVYAYIRFDINEFDKPLTIQRYAYLKIYIMSFKQKKQ